MAIARITLFPFAARVEWRRLLPDAQTDAARRPSRRHLACAAEWGELL